MRERRTGKPARCRRHGVQTPAGHPGARGRSRIAPASHTLPKARIAPRRAWPLANCAASGIAQCASGCRQARPCQWHGRANPRARPGASGRPSPWPRRRAAVDQGSAGIPQPCSLSRIYTGAPCGLRMGNASAPAGTAILVDGVPGSIAIACGEAAGRVASEAVPPDRRGGGAGVCGPSRGDKAPLDLALVLAGGGMRDGFVPAITRRGGGGRCGGP